MIFIEIICLNLFMFLLNTIAEFDSHSYDINMVTMLNLTQMRLEKKNTLSHASTPSEQEPKLGDSIFDPDILEPSIYYTTFGYKNLLYASIFDLISSDGNYIVALYNMDVFKRHVDKVIYITNNFGMEWTLVPFIYNTIPIDINELEANKKNQIVYKREENIVFVSTEAGRNYRAFKLDFKIKSIKLSTHGHQLACVIAIDDSMYIVNDFVSFTPILITRMPFHSVAWTTDPKIFYASWEDERGIINGFEIYLDSLDHPRHILTEVKEISVIKNHHFAIIGKEYRKLYIKRNGVFVLARFPQKLMMKEIKIIDIIEDEIFVGILTKANPIVFSANIKDLRFVRLIESVSYLHSETKGCCYDAFFSKELPGYGIINNVEISPSFPRSSLTSYSNGVIWNPIAYEPTPGENYTQDSDFLTLSLTCKQPYSSKNKIQMVEKAPHILVAEGIVTKKGNTGNLNLLISDDFGKSWRTTRQGAHYSMILDHGSVIVAIPKYSHEIYYSFDEGRVWYNHNLKVHNFASLASIPSHTGNLLQGIFFGIDLVMGEIKFVGVDFTPTLSKKCQLSDYYLYTPGANTIKQCFRGKKSSFWRRKQSSVCLSIANQLPVTDAQMCPCKNTDFGCTFNHFMRKGKCMKDEDAEDDMKIGCDLGKYHWRKSRKNIIDNDECIVNRKHELDLEICGMTENHNFIVTRSKKKFYLIPLEQLILKNEFKSKYPLEFPVQLMDLKAFDIDPLDQCAYFLSTTEISFYCWGNRDKYIKHQVNTFFKIKDITQIQVVPRLGILLYSDRNTISIINLDKLYHTQVISIPGRIETFKYDVAENILMVVCTLNSGYPSRILRIYSLTGTIHCSVIVDSDAKALSLNRVSKRVYVVHSDSFTSYNTKCTEKRQQSSEFSPLINLEVYKNTHIYFTSNGIHDGNTLMKIDDLQESYLFQIETSENPCEKSNCEYFCVPNESNIPQCLCLEHMIKDYNDKCICDSAHPDCKQCKTHQFMCQSGSCIDESLHCNGIKDCEDGSDELNCQYKCTVDEFQCKNNSQCIDKFAVCNGVFDCTDKSDEEDCVTNIQCLDTEFKCQNTKCIPSALVCNGVDECGDNSDEANCDVKKECTESWEFKCGSGECILKAQVCDGEFDCADWSDEANCKKVLVHPHNDTCEIFCDNNCIPKHKVCDHITDCSDASDEKGCGFTSACQASYSLCSSEEYCKHKTEICSIYDPCVDTSSKHRCTMNYCDDIFHFRCLDDKKCIPPNKLCDGVLDCEDGSDETTLCTTKNRVTELTVKSTNGENILLEAKTLQPMSTDHIVVMIVINKNGVIRKESILSSNLEFTILADQYCTTYRIGAWLASSSTFMSAVNYVRKLNRYTAPVDVTLSPKGILTWKLTIPSCYPVMHYTLCEDKKNNVKRHSFVNHTRVISPNNKYFRCQVASCPYPIFNYSCSEFNVLEISRTHNLNMQHKRVNVLAVAIGIVAGIVIILIYVNRSKLFLVIRKVSKKMNKVKFNADMMHNVDAEQALLGEDSSEWLDEYM